jgi:hypothetical protein
MSLGCSAECHDRKGERRIGTIMTSCGPHHIARDALLSLACPAGCPYRVTRPSDTLTPSRRIMAPSFRDALVRGGRATPLLPLVSTGLSGDGFAVREDPGADGTTNAWTDARRLPEVDNNSFDELIHWIHRARRPEAACPRCTVVVPGMQEAGRQPGEGLRSQSVSRSTGVPSCVAETTSRAKPATSPCGTA